MTALETLIRTASRDSDPHYRVLAREAQKELDELRQFAFARAHTLNWQELSESPCPPANSVDK